MSKLRLTSCLALTLCAIALPAQQGAQADHKPVIVIPGRADVPVIIDGVDASGAVVSGEYGLYRAGHVSPVIYPHAYEFAPVIRHGYFPSSGQHPRYGRYEVDTYKGRRARPQNYYRAWSAQSDDRPATIPDRRDPPDVLLAPEFDRGFGK